jgi:hypothetical protein
MSATSAAAGAGTRWAARPWSARAVRALVVAVPLGTAVAVAAVTSRVLDHPRPGTLPWWACVLGVSTLASTVVAAAARRLLPLAALLRLSLAFPDRTPSRFRVALRAGSVVRLRRQVEEVQREGIGAEPARAAETILELATALNVHDARTRGHSERVRALAELVGEELRLPAEDRDRLRWAALLHDCGKLMVHAEVLNKRGGLDDAEWEEVRRHPIEGGRLAAPLAPWLGSWSLAIDEHHERWDGAGYPYGRAGHGIPLGARIVAVADAFEVMTSARSYQTAVTPAAARTELARQAGHQFDPDVVRAFFAVSLGRLRWLVGPFAWLTTLPAIRTAARAPTITAPAALAAFTLAAASALGAVTPPGRDRAAGAAPTHLAASAPQAAAAPSPGRTPASPPAAAPPPDVLAEQVAAPATPTESLVASAPAPVVVGAPGRADLAVPIPASPVVAAACVEAGPVSGVVNGAVEPLAAAVAPPLAQVVDRADCGLVVPTEDLLAGLLGR